MLYRVIVLRTSPVVITTVATSRSVSTILTEFTTMVSSSSKSESIDNHHASRETQQELSALLTSLFFEVHIAEAMDGENGWRRRLDPDSYRIHDIQSNEIVRCLPLLHRPICLDE